jgi:hypothetical protein
MAAAPEVRIRMTFSCLQSTEAVHSGFSLFRTEQADAIDRVNKHRETYSRYHG